MPSVLNLPSRLQCLLLVAEKFFELATYTEAVHQRISAKARSSKAGNELQYYRFNVHHGMEDIAWKDHSKLMVIESSAREYLNEHETRQKVENCVKDLMDIG